MKIMVCTDSDVMSKVAARTFAERIRKKPNIVLGLATGDTPAKMYQELFRMHKEEGLDFSSVVTFNLDEYLGLPGNHAQSYGHFMDAHLFNHINVRGENAHILSGITRDPVAECRAYEEAIKRAGGIDLQLLGIGRNGHIAFNEPGSPKDSRTRVVDLAQETIQSNARFFESIEKVPTKALSMGIGTILEAREIVLLASGASKAAAIAKSIEGPVTEGVPASLLQTHEKVTFVIDEEAAGDLTGTYDKANAFTWPTL